MSERNQNQQAQQRAQQQVQQPAQQQVQQQVQQPAQQGAQQPALDIPNINLPSREQYAAQYSQYAQTAREIARPESIKYSHGADVIIDINGEPVVDRRSGTEVQLLGGAAGVYIVGQDKTRYHTTGTTSDGDSIINHSVDSNQNISLHSKYEGPKVYESVLGSTIRNLGLIRTGDKTYKRPGFGGTYKVQIERDNSFSIHYSGGRNSSGQMCYKQTFHHGHWDRRRNSPLRNQADKWKRYNSIKSNKKTSASSARLLKGSTNSSFSTSTSAITVDSENNSIASDTKLSNIDFKSVTNNEQTWSGTFTQDSGYTLVCRHNNMSGALNLKQDLLSNHAPSVVRDTFAMAINNHVTELDGQSEYRSLLTNQKMLVEIDGKKTVVELMGNGDVKDHTNNNWYRIQVSEGKAISWEPTPLDSVKQSIDDSAPKPMQAPDTEDEKQDSSTDTSQRQGQNPPSAADNVTSNSAADSPVANNPDSSQAQTLSSQVAEQNLQTANQEQVTEFSNRFNEVADLILFKHNRGLGIDNAPSTVLFTKNGEFKTIDQEKHFKEGSNDFQYGNVGNKAFKEALGKLPEMDLNTLPENSITGLARTSNGETFYIFPKSNGQIIAVNHNEPVAEVKQAYASATETQGANRSKLITGEWFEVANSNQNNRWGYIELDGGKIHLANHDFSQIKTWDPEKAIDEVLNKNHGYKDSWDPRGWYDIDDYSPVTTGTEKSNDLQAQVSDNKKEKSNKSNQPKGSGMTDMDRIYEGGGTFG